VGVWGRPATNKQRVAFHSHCLARLINASLKQSRASKGKMYIFRSSGNFPEPFLAAVAVREAMRGGVSAELISLFHRNDKLRPYPLGIKLFYGQPAIGYTLITNNTSDIENIDQLKFIDWVTE
jgi:hypothetical protein